jgi:hypothetical protein
MRRAWFHRFAIGRARTTTNNVVLDPRLRSRRLVMSDSGFAARVVVSRHLSSSSGLDEARRRLLANTAL